MDLLSFFARAVEWSWRLGAIASIAGSAVFALRRSLIEPFASLDSAAYSTLMILAVVGAAIVAVRAFEYVGNQVKRTFERRRKRNAGLKNFEILSPEARSVLSYLRHHNTRRIKARRENKLLREMAADYLLEIDQMSEFGLTRYYEVPRHIWDRLSDDWVKRSDVPADEPWLNGDRM
jgi:hypothetical protein